MKLMTVAAIAGVPLMLVAVLDDAPRAGRTGDAGSAHVAGPNAQACTTESGPAPLPAVIRESSGIAVTADGSLWTHNDGAEAHLFRITEGGALVQTVALEGAHATDVEDVDAGPCPGGSGECLWLADTGDNDGERDHVALLAVAVPAAGATSARPARFAFTYPDGPRDAEGLALLPEGAALVVTKGRDTPIELYRVDVADGATAAARLIAQIAPQPRDNRDRVTGAGASEDGEWIALRTNDGLAVHRTADLLAGRVAPVLTHDLRPLSEAQGEGVDVAADGRVWLTSEGERGTPTLARLRCDVPE